MAALTDKQRRFADEYIANGFNATQAAIKAGYSKKTARKTASENLTKPAIKEYLEERTAAIEEGLVAKGDEVLKFLTRVMRGEEIAETVVFDKDSGAYVETYRDQKNQLKAAELLGKAHGMFTQSVKHEGDLSVTFVNDLPEDDE